MKIIILISLMSLFAQDESKRTLGEDIAEAFFRPLDLVNNKVNVEIIKFVYFRKRQAYLAEPDVFKLDECDDISTLSREKLCDLYNKDSEKNAWMKGLSGYAKIDRSSSALDSPYPKIDFVPEGLVKGLMKGIEVVMTGFNLNYRSRGPISDYVEEFTERTLPAPGDFEGAPAKLPADIRLEYERKNVGDYASLLVLDGPFGDYIVKTKDGFEVDFSVLNLFKTYKGLEPVGSKLYLVYDVDQKKLVSTKIETYPNGEKQTTFKGDANWLKAQRTWASAASFMTTTGEHLGETHLTVAENFTDAQLFLGSHPVRSYLETFGYETKRTNAEVGSLVKDKNSAVPNTFSFPVEEVHKIMNAFAGQFKLSKIDPRKYAEERNMIDSEGITRDPISGEVIDYPLYKQMNHLFNIFMKSNLKFLNLLYGENGDQKIAQDENIQRWFGFLKESFGNQGFSEYTNDELTLNSVAKLMTIYMFNGSVRHESIGNNTYNLTGFHPLVPSRIPAHCQWQSEDTSIRYNYVAYLTMVKLRTLEEGIDKATRYHLNNDADFAPYLSGRSEGEIKYAAEQILDGFMDDLRAHDEELKQNPNKGNFPLYFENMETSVSI